jgi:TonB family protein
MSAAVVLSVALHVFLIYGFAVPAVSSPVKHAIAFDARLEPAPISTSPLQIKAPERNRAHRPAPPAVVLAPPAPSGLADRPAAMQSVAHTEPSRAADVVVSIPTIVDPVHYPAKELDVYPQALSPITPDYPKAALAAQSAGSVTLLVLIDEAGRVTGTSVMDAGPDGLFEQAAKEALAKASFYPAQKEGRTVRSQILIKVEFDANDTNDVQ